MTGWERLWQDPEVRARWEKMPPLPEVVDMADRLEVGGRRRVLDLGCGLGRHTVYLAARGFEVTASDNAPAAIEACRKNLAEVGLGADVTPLDMTKFPFREASFDGVVGSHVIHHTDRATLIRIVDLITRQLAPDGLFVWVTPSTRHHYCGKGEEIEPGTWVYAEHPEGPIPHHYCTEGEVRERLQAYEIISMHEHEHREGAIRRFHWRVLARKREEQ